MRGFLSSLTALLAAVILPIAITAVWTAERVTDTDGYVGAVGPLADDPDVQQALIDRLEQGAADAVGLEELSGSQQRAARQAVAAAVRAVVTNPSFRPIWESANRAGHAELIRTLRADRSGPIAPLDLAVVMEEVLATMRAEGLPVREVRAPGLVFTPDREQLRAAQEGYQALDAARIVLPVVWVALVVIALAVARRRLRALAILAGASIVSVALMWPVLAVLRSGALDAVPAADRELGEAVWDGVTQSLERSALVAVIVAAVALVVAMVLGVVRSGRSAPEAGDGRC